MKMKQKNKHIILAMLLLISTSLVLGGCNNPQNFEPKTSIEIRNQEKDYKFVQNGSFVVGKDFKLISLDKIPDKNTNIIEWYFDPLCPACVKLESLMKDKNKNIVNDGKLLIRYYPMGFLSARSLDDYSNRASAYILAVAESYPDLAYKYLNEIMSESFIPIGENSDGIKKSDEAFLNAFYRVGGSNENWGLVKKNFEVALKQVKESSLQASNNVELQNKSYDKKIYTPFIIIGDTPQALNFNDKEDALEYMTNEINSYKNKIEPIKPKTIKLVEGFKKSYKENETVLFKVKAKNAKSYKWIIKDIDGKKTVLEENKNVLQYTINKKDEYIIVQSLNDKGEQIEMIKEKIYVDIK